MKKWIPFIVILFSLLASNSSCKMNLFDVTEDFYISTTVNVTGNNAAFSGTELLDAIQACNMINEYASHLKSIEITEIKYYVSYFNGPITQQINTATLSIADEYGNDVYEVATISNIVLSNASNETVLPLNETAVSKLADLIKNDPNKATIYLSGVVNETPVDFSVVFKFKVKMVAEMM